MASQVPKIFIIGSSSVAPLDAVDFDVETGGRDKKEDNKWLFPANILRHVVNVADYLGTHPHKYIYNGTFCKERRICQQIVCVFMHLLLLYGSMGFIVDKIPEKLKVVKRPSLYFTFVLAVSGFIFTFLNIKGFWLESQKYLQILQTLQQDKDLPTIEILVDKPWIVLVVVGQLVAKLVFYLLIGYEAVSPISNLNPSSFSRTMVKNGRHMFLFQTESNNSNIPDWDNITVLDGVLGAFSATETFAAYSLYETFKTLMLACALILWLESRTLAKNVEALDKGEQSWPQIYNQFKAVQRLSMVIYEALSNTVFWYLVVNLAFFSINLNILLVSDNYVSRMKNLLTFSNIICFLYFSADIRKQVNTVDNWVQRDGNSRNVTDEQERTIKQEAKRKDIGIHAGKYFTITFGIIYAFVGLTITFFLLCVADGWFENL